MAALIDASLWVDFTRFRSPVVLKRFIEPFVLDPSAHAAEPVIFELLRHARDEEIKPLTEQFESLPLLPSPADLWSKAAKLGQRCRGSGFVAGALDLLIASIAIEHEAELVTFDSDYLSIAKNSELRVRLLRRPTG